MKNTVAKGSSARSSMLARSSMPHSDAEGGASLGARHGPRQWSQQANGVCDRRGGASPSGRCDSEREARWRRRIHVGGAHDEQGGRREGVRIAGVRERRKHEQRGGLRMARRTHLNIIVYLLSAGV
jgi:hypothetical protein